MILNTFKQGDMVVMLHRDGSVHITNGRISALVASSKYGYFLDLGKQDFQDLQDILQSEILKQSKRVIDEK